MGLRPARGTTPAQVGLKWGVLGRERRSARTGKVPTWGGSRLSGVTCARIGHSGPLPEGVSIHPATASLPGRWIDPRPPGGYSSGVRSAVNAERQW